METCPCLERLETAGKRLVEVCLLRDAATRHTYSTLLTPGASEPTRTILVHGFCPFCGIRALPTDTPRLL